MTAGQQLAERRKYTRFQVKNPAFVFKALHVGRIVDISMDGLAFTYDGRETWPRQAAALDLLIDEDIFLGPVPVRVVSDILVSEEPRYGLLTRQCGVQFGRLTPDQVHQLEYFIRINMQERPHPSLGVENLLGSLGYD